MGPTVAPYIAKASLEGTAWPEAAMVNAQRLCVGGDDTLDTVQPSQLRVFRV